MDTKFYTVRLGLTAQPNSTFQPHLPWTVQDTVASEMLKELDASAEGIEKFSSHCLPSLTQALNRHREIPAAIQSWELTAGDQASVQALLDQTGHMVLSAVRGWVIDPEANWRARQTQGIPSEIIACEPYEDLAIKIKIFKDHVFLDNGRQRAHLYLVTEASEGCRTIPAGAQRPTTLTWGANIGHDASWEQ